MPGLPVYPRDDEMLADLKILQQRTPRMTAQQIADHLGVSRATYYRLAKMVGGRR